MRFRNFGFAPGFLEPGGRNMISDVPGVRVGHCTRREGDRIRTGVTVVDPGVVDLFHNKIPAAAAVGNGFGKLAGISQIQELGTLETPIALTNTLSVGAVLHGLVKHVLNITPSIKSNSTINAVVGETNDGLLNDIHAMVIEPQNVADAFETLSADFELGSVGAGTGTRAFNFKGGIGSASRKVSIDGSQFTLGALVQTNFGGALSIMGVPIGEILGSTSFDDYRSIAGDGSCMIVIAVDAPLSARQLGRIAHRGLLGLVRTGSIMAHGSGDYAIAFSTNRAGFEGVDASGLGSCIPEERLNSFFLAAVEAVEESVYDALFAAETVTGFNGATLSQIPTDQIVEILRNRIGANV